MMDQPRTEQTRERRRQRLPDDHPAVLMLKQVREYAVLIHAAAEAARAQDDRAFYAALERLDEALKLDP